MRVVLRVGGSVVASPIDTELMGKFAEMVKALRKQHHEVAAVVGGGKLAREFICIAKNLEVDVQAQDEIAISVSRLFAELFLAKLGDSGCGKVAVTLDEAAECLRKGKIMVMGGLRPGFTTAVVPALGAGRVRGALWVKG